YGHILSGANAAIPSYMESATGGPGVSMSYPQGAGYKKIARNELVLQPHELRFSLLPLRSHHQCYSPYLVTI
ncbi:MAG: hypothetical protein WA125_06585, partial [Desulfosporosinus sp.]